MAKERRIYRYLIPINDRWQTLSLSGDIVHVGCRHLGLVEVWAYVTGDDPVDRAFRVFEDGQTIPPAATGHAGTVIDPDGIAFHLIEHEPSRQETSHGR